MRIGSGSWLGANVGDPARARCSGATPSSPPARSCAGRFPTTSCSAAFPRRSFATTTAANGWQSGPAGREQAQPRRRPHAPSRLQAVPTALLRRLHHARSGSQATYVVVPFQLKQLTHSPLDGRRARPGRTRAAGRLRALRRRARRPAQSPPADHLDGARPHVLDRGARSSTRCSAIPRSGSSTPTRSSPRARRACSARASTRSTRCSCRTTCSARRRRSRTSATRPRRSSARRSVASPRSPSARHRCTRRIW